MKKIINEIKGFFSGQTLFKYEEIDIKSNPKDLINILEKKGEMLPISEGNKIVLCLLKDIYKKLDELENKLK